MPRRFPQFESPILGQQTPAVRRQSQLADSEWTQLLQPLLSSSLQFLKQCEGKYLSNLHCWNGAVKKGLVSVCFGWTSHGKELHQSLLSSVHFSSARKLSAECQHFVHQTVEDVPCHQLGLVWSAVGKMYRPIQRLLSPWYHTNLCYVMGFLLNCCALFMLDKLLGGL